MKFLSILRPSHWSKNVFVFAALVFGRKLIGPSHEVWVAVASSIAAFFCFSLAASSMYIINDIMDRNSDRCHPEKSRRPIAAGEIGVGEALVLAAVCGATALIGSYLLVTTFAIIIAVYLIMNLLYSFWFKSMMIVDVIIIAIGFVLRAVAGAIVVGVFISPWLIVCTFALCLFMGFSKRYGEIRLLANNGTAFRRTLGGYNLELLNHMLDVSSGLAIVCFLLYSRDERTIKLFSTGNLMFTVPLVLYCVFRFSALIQKGRYSSPVQIMLKDRPFEIGLVLWALSCIAIIYAKHLGLDLSDLVAY
jgi:4-hydroxybenzoate polyprenyltransferase